MENKNVFADLMNVSDEKIHKMIGELDTVFDVKEMKQEYSELKEHFRAYKRGEFKLESDEDKRAYSEKLSEYLRLQRAIKENEQEEHKEILATPYEELIKEHKRLSVFYINSDYIRWADEKLVASEEARKKYEKVVKEKEQFAEEGKELRELKRQLRVHKNGEIELENKEYSEKLSRFLELNMKKKRIDKDAKDVQNELEGISDEEIEKAYQIMKIVTDENNWDILMETPLESLLNEPEKLDGKQEGKKADEELEDKESEYKKEKKTANEKQKGEPQDNKPKQETGPRIVEMQNGQAKSLNPETNAQNPQQSQDQQQAPKVEKPVFKDEEEHSDLIDPYGEWNWKEYLKNLPSDVINLIKEVRETKKVEKQERKERFIKEYEEKNGKKPNGIQIFIGTHKRINKMAEFFKEVGKASQRLTPEEQEAGKTILKRGFSFKSDREKEENHPEAPIPGSFKDRRDAFINRDDIASDIQPEQIIEFEDISSNSKDNEEVQVATDTENSQDDAR